ncbi:MAG: DNA adenine methylase, partial [Acidobacteriota bacterium]
MIGPLPYIGGKNRLAKRIISLFPEHRTYVEPFVGGGQVFFHKPASAVEVLNDLDTEVVNFLRICQNHPEELVRCARHLVVSRRWYELMQKTRPETLTDIQRAVRFFYLQKNTYGARVVRQNFKYGITHPPNFSPERIPEIIERTHQRLQGVQLECLPYEDVLARYDRRTTLFYLDPPYWDRKLYRFNFTEEDFRQLVERLRRLKGHFILSLGDTPEVRT